MGPAFIQAKSGCVDDPISRLSHNVPYGYRWLSETNHTAAGWVPSKYVVPEGVEWIEHFDLENGARLGHQHRPDEECKECEKIYEGKLYLEKLRSSLVSVK